MVLPPRRSRPFFPYHGVEPESRLPEPGSSAGGRPENPERLSGPNSRRPLHNLRCRLGQSLRFPKNVRILDPRFSRYSYNYFIQAGLAACSMLLILVFVDSQADAALAAGLGASVAIVFIHPASAAGRYRSLIGGHALGLVLGTTFSFFLFNSPPSGFLGDMPWLFDVVLAFSVGVMILVMAVTDTEHPPAVGTLLGVPVQPWHWETPAVLIAAVILLSVIRYLCQPHLRDLT